MATRRKLSRRVSYYARDITNIIRFGLRAPKSAQLIWVRPRSVTAIIIKPTGNIDRLFMPRRNFTGRILDGDWDREVTGLKNISKVNGCYDRYVRKIRWEETDLIRGHLRSLRTRGRHSKGDSEEKILERYRRLDRLYETAMNDGLSPQRLVEPGAFREEGGIYVHIARNGTPIFGGGGFHRLAIAQILNLNVVPAQLGVVHTEFWEAKQRIPDIVG